MVLLMDREVHNYGLLICYWCVAMHVAKDDMPNAHCSLTTLPPESKIERATSTYAIVKGIRKVVVPRTWRQIDLHHQVTTLVKRISFFYAFYEMLNNKAIRQLLYFWQRPWSKRGKNFNNVIQKQFGLVGSKKQLLLIQNDIVFSSERNLYKR